MTPIELIEKLKQEDLKTHLEAYVKQVESTEKYWVEQILNFQKLTISEIDEMIDDGLFNDRYLKLFKTRRAELIAEERKRKIDGI